MSRHTMGVLFSLDKPIGAGGVVCLCQHLVPLDKQINAIPVGMI